MTLEITVLPLYYTLIHSNTAARKRIYLHIQSTCQFRIIILRVHTKYNYKTDKNQEGIEPWMKEFAVPQQKPSVTRL